MDQIQGVEKSEQKESTKKCFCARCFTPIESGHGVDIDGQHFHRECCMCSICNKIPTSVKLFYGHVFCPECFKNFVLNKFKSDLSSENPWCMHWPCVMNAHCHHQGNPHCANCSSNKDAEKKVSEDKEDVEENEGEGGCKDKEASGCMCARCQRAVDERFKVEIGGQVFHPHCARCCCCHSLPKNNVKMFCNHAFCEECYSRFILGRNLSGGQMQRNATEDLEEFMKRMDQLQQSLMTIRLGSAANCAFQERSCQQSASHVWFPAPEPRECKQSA